MTLPNQTRLVSSIGKIFNSAKNFVTHTLIALMARQVNTTPSLFWTLFHILNNPEICLEVESEIRTLFKAKRGAEVKEVKGKFLSLDDVLSLEKKDLDQLVVIVEHQVVMPTNLSCNCEQFSCCSAFDFLTLSEATIYSRKRYW